MAAYLSERVGVISALAPVDLNTASAPIKSYRVKMSNYERVMFVIAWGLISNSATAPVIKLVKATTSSGTGTAIAGMYRVSSTGGAAGTIEDGDLTELTTSGLTVAVANDYFVYTFEAKVPADTGTDYPYVGVDVTTAPGSFTCPIAIVAIASEARWMQATPPSPTA